jgi:hypothetical protein
VAKWTAFFPIRFPVAPAHKNHLPVSGRLEVTPMRKTWLGNLKKVVVDFHLKLKPWFQILAAKRSYF